MLVVKVSPRRTVYVELTEDTFPNKGGYYGEVYADENKEFKLDDFTLQGRDLRGFDNPRKQAIVMANDKVKRMFAK